MEGQMFIEDKFTPTIEQVSADGRGEMYVVNLPNDMELVLLHSVKGSLRGGHAHDVDEVVVMLTGEMSYYKRDKSGKESGRVMQAGDTSFNPAGLFHMGEFLQDSWVIEQKLAKKGEWRNLDYQPWREQVVADSVS